ncbi:MAG TPA: ABC-F family ATP-binding cassette domain-containing protein [Phenylobacterium sp.]
MGSISLKNLGLTATDTLFSNLNLTIADGDRVALVAGNGMGKTTLMRAIAGLAELTTGEIVRSRGLTVGYVEQDTPAASLDATLYDVVAEGLPPGERESGAWRVDLTLDELETPEELRRRPMRELSGGWRRMALLAKAWVQQPDALLLDEPTNHLDLAALLRLERWLESTAGDIPLIVTAHDRAFLDAVTNRTLFLRPDTSHYFPLPYSRAKAALDEMDQAAEARRERELKEAGKLRQQAAKLTNIGINSGSDLLTVKSKQLRERAGKIEAQAVAVHKERSGDIRLSNSGVQAKVLIAIEDRQVTSPPGGKLFRIDKLHVFQGDRIVILGRNGTGKSQFVQLLRRALAGEAEAGVRVNPSVVPGYVDQAMSQLPAKGSLFEFIAHRFDQGDQRSRALLAGAGFPVEKQGRSIAELSFGQRARLGLLALRLTEPNLYLLDEPTNHVDIAGQERLEAEILAQGATCIVASHDRQFVRAIGTRFLQIERGRLVEVDSPEDFFASMAVA